MKTQKMSNILANELKRVGYTSFEHDQYALTMSDLASLSHTPQFASTKSVFRVNKEFLDGKDFVRVKIIDANLIQIDSKFFKATFESK